jgi:hypothetical protein
VRAGHDRACVVYEPVATYVATRGLAAMGELNQLPRHVVLAGDLAALLFDLEVRVREFTPRPMTPLIAAEARRLHDEWVAARKAARLPPDPRLTERLEAVERASSPAVKRRRRRPGSRDRPN